MGNNKQIREYRNTFHEICLAIFNITGITEPVLIGRKRKTSLNALRGLLYVIGYKEGIPDTYMHTFVKRGRSTVTIVKLNYQGFIMYDKTLKELYNKIYTEYNNIKNE